MYVSKTICVWMWMCSLHDVCAQMCLHSCVSVLSACHQNDFGMWICIYACIDCYVTISPNAMLLYHQMLCCYINQCLCSGIRVVAHLLWQRNFLFDEWQFFVNLLDRLVGFEHFRFKWFSFKGFRGSVRVWESTDRTLHRMVSISEILSKFLRLGINLPWSSPLFSCYTISQEATDSKCKQTLSYTYRK